MSRNSLLFIHETVGGNMSFEYIQFDSPNSGIPKETPRRFRSWIEKFLPHFIPKANPDFDHLIEQVAKWQVEVNQEGIPEREIGFSVNDIPLMIMPWNNNYGYWTDNNLTLNDFKSLFNVSEISKDLFLQKWYEFGDLGCLNCFHSEITRFLNKRTWLEFDLELTKKLGKHHVKQIKTANDGIPDKDEDHTIYQCQNCETKWKLKEPYDRGSGYFKGT